MPAASDGLHRLAELRSLALHRAVAAALLERPELVEHARDVVRRQRAAGVMHRDYAARWYALLEAPLDALRAALVADTEIMAALRQCTPFTFVVPPRDRWAIWRDVRARWERGDAA